MASMPRDPLRDRGEPDSAAPADPFLTEALRSALQTVLAEQTFSQPPARPAPAANEQDQRKPPAWRGQIGQIVGTVLVAAVACLGVYTYVRVGEEQARNRSQVGQLRAEVGKLRPQMVRKDEFTSRELAIHALLYDVEVNAREERKHWQESITELKEARADTRLQVRDLKDESRRAAARVQKLEERLNKRPGPTTPEEKKGGR
jgi:hypothetical protein